MTNQNCFASQLTMTKQNENEISNKMAIEKTIL